MLTIFRVPFGNDYKNVIMPDKRTMEAYTSMLKKTYTYFNIETIYNYRVQQDTVIVTVARRFDYLREFNYAIMDNKAYFVTQIDEETKSPVNNSCRLTLTYDAWANNLVHFDPVHPIYSIVERATVPRFIGNSFDVENNNILPETLDFIENELQVNEHMQTNPYKMLFMRLEITDNNLLAENKIFQYLPNYEDGSQEYEFEINNTAWDNSEKIKNISKLELPCRYRYHKNILYMPVMLYKWDKTTKSYIPQDNFKCFSNCQMLGYSIKSLTTHPVNYQVQSRILFGKLSSYTFHCPVYWNYDTGKNAIKFTNAVACNFGIQDDGSSETKYYSVGIFFPNIVQLVNNNSINLNFLEYENEAKHFKLTEEIDLINPQDPEINYSNAISSNPIFRDSNAHAENLTDPAFTLQSFLKIIYNGQTFKYYPIDNDKYVTDIKIIKDKRTSQCRLYITDNGVPVNNKFGDLLNNSGEITFAIDSLADYRARNGSQNLLTAGINAVKGIIDLKTGNVAGAIQSGINILDLYAKKVDANNTPDTYIAGMGEDDIILQDDVKVVRCEPNRESPLWETYCGDIYNYGYKVSKYIDIFTRNRKCFDYIKTIDVELPLRINARDRNILKTMYDNGVTIWYGENLKNNKWMSKDYRLYTNPEINLL